jgi:hypothetical protein
LVGTVEGALVAHTLGVKRLIGRHVLGLLDFAEEIVDGKISFAGTCGLVGHGKLAIWGSDSNGERDAVMQCSADHSVYRTEREQGLLTGGVSNISGRSGARRRHRG